MIVQVLLFDALILGVVSSVAGLLLGDLLSIVLFNSSPQYLSFAFPIGTRRIVTATSVLLCVGGGMLAALTGVFGPLRGAIFARHGEFFGAPSWAAPSQSPVAAGRRSALFLVATSAILLLAPSAAITGIVTLSAALLLSLPVLLDVLPDCSIACNL